MSELPFVDGAAIRSLVPFADAVAAIKEAFASPSVQLERTVFEVAGADVLVMPAGFEDVAGVKIVAVQPSNRARSEPVIQGTYVLIDAIRGRPIATLDGAALTALRTPAVSALVTRRLARPGARTVAVIGAGPQGVAHRDAMRWALPMAERVVLVARGDTMPDDIDVVCTCTSSATPVLARTSLAPGAHCNVIGSYRPDRREVAASLIAASIVVVDDRSAASAEAGDLILAVEEGRWTWDQVAGDLHDVVAGRVERRGDDELTLFKSVGLALQDLAVARLVARRAGLHF